MALSAFLSAPHVSSTCASLFYSFSFSSHPAIFRLKTLHCRLLACNPHSSFQLHPGTRLCPGSCVIRCNGPSAPFVICVSRPQKHVSCFSVRRRTSFSSLADCITQYLPSRRLLTCRIPGRQRLKRSPVCAPCRQHRQTSSSSVGPVRKQPNLGSRNLDLRRPLHCQKSNRSPSNMEAHRALAGTHMEAARAA